MVDAGQRPVRPVRRGTLPISRTSTTTRSTWATTCPHPVQRRSGRVPQTWWGFPTWRETLSPSWNDPDLAGERRPRPQPAVWPGLPAGDRARGERSQFLPDMPRRRTATPHQPYNDGHACNTPSADRRTGSSTFCRHPRSVPASGSQSWEDDLIMTGVRSFDVKAYDNALANYADLGWGDDLAAVPACYRRRIWAVPTTTTTTPYWRATTTPVEWPRRPGRMPMSTDARSTLLNQTFAHEGRMPPLIERSPVRRPVRRARRRYSANSFPPANDTYTATSATTNRGSSASGGSGTPGPPITARRRARALPEQGRCHRPVNGFPRAPVLAAGLSVVSAAVPGAAPRHPDPDPRRRSHEPADQVIDDPAGFHG